MRIPFLSLLAAGLTGLAGCEASRTASEARSAPAASAVLPDSLTQGFQRQLTQGTYQFAVAGGAGRNAQITIRTRHDGRLAAEPLRLVVPGRPTDAVATDLDGNGLPELFIFSNDGAVGGGFHGYELGPTGFGPLAGPGALPGAAGLGYAGNDVYFVSGQTLVRSFPVASDAAASRTVTYRLLPTHQWKVRQVMNGPR